MEAEAKTPVLPAGHGPGATSEGDARRAKRSRTSLSGGRAGSAGTGGDGGSGRWLLLSPPLESDTYLTFAPEGTAGSTMRSDGSPVSGSVAARIIPFDSTPMSFAGARFATKTNFLPTSCSAA